MPQDQDTLEKELRRQMREGRTPLIQAVRDTYEPFLLAKKGWERKNAELREQVGLLNNQFSTKGKQLRESSRKSTDSGASMVDLYKDLSKQAKAVSTLIDNVLRNMGYGWYDQPLSDALLSSGFYLGMCHGGNITPKSHQLREASSILTLTDATFAAGYTSGLTTIKAQTDNGFMELLHTQAINHVTEQEIAYTLGIWIGSLSHMLKNTLLPAPASEAVTSITR